MVLCECKTNPKILYKLAADISYANCGPAGEQFDTKGEMFGCLKAHPMWD